VVILGDTRPGVDPIHAGTQVADVKKYEGSGIYTVVPLLTRWKRRVHSTQLQTCVDGFMETFQRGGAKNSSCVREVAAARKEAKKSSAQAKKETKKRKQAEKQREKAVRERRAA
jgi:hypothetical protein